MKVTKKMKKNAPGLAAYWSKKNRKAKHGAAKPKRKKKKHHHTEGHMAKAKRKKKHGGKRRGGGSASRRSHRRSHHGGITGDLILAGGGLAFGFVEKKMKEDAGFFLNKVPTPIGALGRTGNLTLGLYLLSYVLPGNWKRHARTAAKVGAIITGYQLGRKGESFKEGADFFTISGAEDGERFIGDDDIGQLADEMSGHRVRGEFDVHVDDDEFEHHLDDHHDDEHHDDPSGASTPGVLQPVSPT